MAAGRTGPEPDEAPQGLPEHREVRGHRRALSLFARAALALALPVGLLVAWQQGIFEQADLRTRAASTPCGALFRAHDAEQLGLPGWELADVQTRPGHCSVEVAAPPGSRAPAGLRVEMQAGIAEGDFAEFARPFGQPREPVPELGPEAFRVRRREGQVVGLRANDVGVVVLFPADVHDDSAVAAAIELLVTRSVGVVAP